MHKYEMLFLAISFFLTIIFSSFSNQYIASLNQPLSQRTRTIDSLDSGRDAAGCFESGDFAAAEEKMLKAHLEMQSDATMGVSSIPFPHYSLTIILLLYWLEYHAIL